MENVLRTDDTSILIYEGSSTLDNHNKYLEYILSRVTASIMHFIWSRHPIDPPIGMTERVVL